MMNRVETEWKGNDLPTQSDKWMYVALAAIATFSFLLTTWLTSIVLGVVPAAIMALVGFFGYRATLARPEAVALQSDGMFLRDRRGEETWVPWTSILRIRPASRNPKSHYVCIFRGSSGRARAIPLGYEIGARIEARLSGRVPSSSA
jgi:hypothetical protein